VDHQLYIYTKEQNKVNYYFFINLFFVYYYLLFINLYNLHNKGISFYTALVGNPSTGKSPALNVVFRCMLDIETYRQVPAMDSPITNAATIEALLEYLNTLQQPMVG
jgi:hypothetical protein